MFIKMISVNFMIIYLVNNVINGVNLVKIGHFLVKMVKIGSFSGQNDVISQNFGKAVKKFSLKVSKNYLTQVYGHIFGQKCH